MGISDIMLESEQLNQLLESAQVETWRQVLFGLGSKLGFDQVLFGMVGSRHARLESAFLESNYSSDWREHYDANGLGYVDPTVAHCMGSSLPIVWAPEAFGTRAQRELYEQACGYGIRTGVTLPIHGPKGEFGVISFASDAPATAAFARDVNHLMPTLALLRDYAFASSSRFMGSEGGKNVAPRLTPRELDMLRWVMAGKSSWEISRINRCSEATVNFHLANVRQKFNVNTRQQAVVKAIALGLVTPEDRRR